MRSVRALGLARIPNAARLGDHPNEVVQRLVTVHDPEQPLKQIEHRCRIKWDQAAFQVELRTV